VDRCFAANPCAFPAKMVTRLSPTSVRSALPDSIHHSSRIPGEDANYAQEAQEGSFGCGGRCEKSALSVLRVSWDAGNMRIDEIKVPSVINLCASMASPNGQKGFF
jgi:hypothetical protein